MLSIGLLLNPTKKVQEPKDTPINKKEANRPGLACYILTVATFLSWRGWVQTNSPVSASRQKITQFSLFFKTIEQKHGNG